MDRAEIRDLKEKRARVWEQSKALLDDATASGWTAENETKWAALDADITALTTSIDRGEKLLALDARDAELDAQRRDETGTSRDEYDAVFRAYLAQGAADLEPAQRRVLQANTSKSLPKNALGVGTGGAGGYTVPEGFWQKVTETQKAFGGVAGVANTITTDTGNDLPWMTNDDTSNEGAILAENAAVSEQDVSFGTNILGAYLYTSKLIRVSVQLLQDSSVDIESFLARKAGVRLARIHNRHQTTGTGTGQPRGIVTGATTGKTTNSSTAITFDEIVDLVHSVDPAYRQGDNVAFMVNDAILAYLRKVRDDSGGAGVGRPLWEPSVQVGAPSTLFGYPYIVNQHMASTVAASNTTALFGNFNEGYVIRNVAGATAVRLAERYAEYLQVGFFVYDRQDATTDDTNAYKALVQKA